MNIFVGNLSRDVNEQELREAFESFGEVVSVSIIKDKMTGQPRGFGFVEMADKDAAQNAINSLNGTDLKGKAINVNEARPKQDRPRRPGGSGPRRGGFGGGFGGNGGSRDRGGFGGGRGRF